MKVALFIPCYVDALFPEVGVASWKLLKHLGVDVSYPKNQTCCGQPMGNAGFEDKAIPLAKTFEERFKGYDYGYGTFISGPSKTADIAQVLVMGAQAARSVTVLITR